jgi:hypothetical protein
MMNQCPHCQEKLNLSSTQLSKIQAALTTLTNDNLLKINCPLCKKTIELTASGELAYANRPGSSTPVPRQKRLKYRPPQPPKLEWLSGINIEDEEEVGGTLEVLVLMADGPARQNVVEGFKEMAYIAVFPKSPRDAIERMRFHNYAAIVLHSRYEGNTLAESVFHTHMKKLAMAKRRSIFYTLIGPEFHTYYNLEALINSANLVMNDKELPKMGPILRKAIPEYEKLFAPYVDVLLELGNTEGLTWSDVRRRIRGKVESDVLKDLLSIS